MRITALSAPFPGVQRVFEEGKKLGFWQFAEFGPERVQIPPADVYILGAWHPFYEELLKVLEGKVGILWTSSGGEMGFEPVERRYLTRIITDSRISFVWFGDKSLAQVYEKGFYAPYPIACDLKPATDQKRDIVTLFCPPTLKKNIVNQLVAAALLQRQIKLTMHTNVSVDSEFARSIGLDFTQHGWLERGEYHKLLSESKLNLAVSWAETFNYQVAEATMLGTPSVVSTTIPWLPFHHAVLEPNDPLAIVEKALDVYQDPDAASEQRLALLEYAREASQKLQVALSRLSS